MGCIWCGRGFCEECRQGYKRQCCCQFKATSVLGSSNSSIVTNSHTQRAVRDPNNPDGSSSSQLGRPQLSDEELTNAKATGRKRSHVAVAKDGRPLNKDLPCEWQRKINCGGGNRPIVGCLNGYQRHVHHGPDKNVLNNEPHNLHRICWDCHNRWHSKNDSQQNPSIPHEPREVPYKEFIDAYTEAYAA